jgi:hypothetical protein
MLVFTPNAFRTSLGFALFLSFAPLACGDDDDEGPPPEYAGKPCSAPDQCYPEVEGELQGGGAVCLPNVPNGYCTHTCTDDAQCCAVPGECATNLEQVCSPLESQPQKYCFVSCEDSYVRGQGFEDSSAFCQRFAHPSFNCRSTGGGSENRKVCLPG